MSRVCLAIDIGGTKIRAGLIDQAGKLHHGTRVATDASRGATQVLASIGVACDELLTYAAEQHVNVAGLGVSSCGVIDPQTGRVVSSAPSIPGWEGTALGEALSNKYAMPVVADNDANCALVGEVWHGGHLFGANDTIVMFTLGTGLGGAIMVGDRLITGKHHITGHFGIAPLWAPHLGHNVPTEFLVSGSGLANIYKHFVPDVDPSTNGEVVMSLATAGGSNASKAMNLWLDHLAQLITSYYWILDPHALVIGGGVVHSHQTWWPGLVNRLELAKVTTPLIRATQGNDAGIYGAAKLFFDRVAV
jgi:glucokinase